MDHPRQRRRRPDEAVPLGNTDTDTPPEPNTEGGDVSDEDQQDLDEQPSGEQVKDEATKPLNLKGPFSAVGIRVLDGDGRNVAIVGMAHAALPVREEAARFIADKLNG
jgi:hypothetical protein